MDACSLDFSVSFSRRFSVNDDLKTKLDQLIANDAAYATAKQALVDAEQKKVADLENYISAVREAFSGVPISA